MFGIGNWVRLVWIGFFLVPCFWVALDFPPPPLPSFCLLCALFLHRLIDLIPAETSFPVQFHRNFRVRLINPDNIQFYPAIISILDGWRDVRTTYTSANSSQPPTHEYRNGSWLAVVFACGETIHRPVAASPPFPFFKWTVALHILQFNCQQRMRKNSPTTRKQF